MSQQKRPIVLRTLYRPKTNEDGGIIVTSYKTDPRGEEYFAEAMKQTSINLKETFIHRVVCYSGEGTHVALLNTRLMMAVNDLKTTFSETLNVVPRSTDYKNPYDRKTRSDGVTSRISLCETNLIYVTQTKMSEPHMEEDMLKRIFADNVIERLPRRPRHEVEQIVQNPSEGERTRPAQTRIRFEIKNDRDSRRERDSTSLQELQILAETPTTSRPIVSEDAFLKSCYPQCIQHGICYSPKQFELSYDRELIQNYTKKAIDSISARFGEMHKFTADVEQLSTLSALVMNKECKIVAYVASCPRVRGLILLPEELGLIVVEENLA